MLSTATEIQQELYGSFTPGANWTYTQYVDQDLLLKELTSQLDALEKNLTSNPNSQIDLRDTYIKIKSLLFKEDIIEINYRINGLIAIEKLNIIKASITEGKKELSTVIQEEIMRYIPIVSIIPIRDEFESFFKPYIKSYRLKKGNIKDENIKESNNITKAQELDMLFCGDKISAYINLGKKFRLLFCEKVIDNNLVFNNKDELIEEINKFSNYNLSNNVESENQVESITGSQLKKLNVIFN
jgi:hypothetical protein